MKILLVDDSVATLDTFKAMFEMEGHVVFVAANATGAMSHLKQRPEVDLLITDHFLPDENGLSLCVKVREFSEMPILLITAADEQVVSDLRKSVEPLGNVMVLRKPVEPLGLIYLISGLRGPDSKLLKRS